MACFAPTEALQRLEVISDTFLSMSTPIQGAIPAWLSQRAAMQAQISSRVERNLASLDARLARQNLVTRLEVEAGWYVVLRVPGLQTDEEMALQLLLERAVVVHPGGFFGFPGQGWLVISLLALEREFHQGIEAVLQHLS
jgi:alanine-synthesizing transaminase